MTTLASQPHDLKKLLTACRWKVAICFKSYWQCVARIKKKHFFNQGLPHHTEYDRNLTWILETSIQKENTWSELKIANRYRKTTVAWSNARTPNTHVMPRRGRRTMEHFMPSLSGNIRDNCHQLSIAHVVPSQGGCFLSLT